MTKAMDDALDAIQDKEQKINSFGEILDGLDNTADKKKLLWKEIYENALTDRENAYTLFSDLLQQSHGNAANHAMFGATMAKYLERMSKSNDQILRLAELIGKSEEQQSTINPDEIFDKIIE